MCDLKAIEEIIECTENIEMIQRWAQELIGYHFTIIHRKENMMMDFDTLTRQCILSYALHLSIFLSLC